MVIDTNRIYAIMAERGLCAAEVAARAGLHRQNFGAIIKRGTCQPPTAGKIAKALGVSVGEIMGKQGKG